MVRVIRKFKKNNGLNYGLGVTLTPLKGFQIRLYGGLNEGDEDSKKNITNMAAFMGYKCEKFTIGAEYNYLMNASFKDDCDQKGYSIFASVNLSKETAIYARFDDLYSKNNWNYANDESTAILGAQFKLGKYVKIAPNFRVSMPKLDGSKESYSAFINCYFGF